MSALEELHPDLAALVGTVIHDRYRVDSLLGRGGMGAVFKAHHLGLRRDVAIKVLRPGLSADVEMGKRFDREGHSISRLDHPNCVRVSDFGTTDGDIKYLVMELLEGRELEADLGQAWAAGRAIDTTIQILEGLEHAHHFAIVHRDLKPENVFLTQDFRGREVVKLVDFGIAKLLEDDGGEKLTRAGMVFGTPRYMSPEQASGGKLDERTDLYATGLLLYEMLAGGPPFEAKEVTVLLRMQILAPPPPLPSAVPAPLAAVVTKLLEKSRKERYSSAREAISALEAARAQLSGMSSSPAASHDAHDAHTSAGASASGSAAAAATQDSAAAATALTGLGPALDTTAASASSSIPSGWHAASATAIPAGTPPLPPLGPAASGPAASGPALSGPSMSGPGVSAPAISNAALSGPGVSAPAMSAPAMSAPAMSAPASALSASNQSLPTGYSPNPATPLPAPGSTHAPTLALDTPASGSSMPKWLLWAFGFAGIMLALMAFGAGRAMQGGGQVTGMEAKALAPNEADDRFDDDCGDKVCGCEGENGNLHECELACGRDCSMRCAGAARCELEVDAGSWVHCEDFGTCKVSCLGDCRVTCPGGKCSVECPLPPEDDDGKPKRGKKKAKRPKATQCSDELYVCGSCDALDDF